MFSESFTHDTQKAITAKAQAARAARALVAGGDGDSRPKNHPHPRTQTNQHDSMHADDGVCDAT